MSFFHRFTKTTKRTSKNKKGPRGFLWKINPTMEEELVRQAFERKQSGRSAKRRGKRICFWHIDKDHETMVLNKNTDKELEVKVVEEKGPSEWTVQNQDKDQAEKDSGDKGSEPQSDEEVEGACANNDGSKDVDGNDKALDLSSSSCSSDILIFSESD